MDGQEEGAQPEGKSGGGGAPSTVEDLGRERGRRAGLPPVTLSPNNLFSLSPSPFCFLSLSALLSPACLSSFSPSSPLSVSLFLHSPKTVCDTEGSQTSFPGVDVL